MASLACRHGPNTRIEREDLIRLNRLIMLHVEVDAASMVSSPGERTCEF